MRDESTNQVHRSIPIQRRDAAVLLLVGLVALLTIPGSYHPIRAGLDPSWMWGINAFAAAGFQWGRDVIFSYGPLGYLARPLDVGSNLLSATVVYLIVHATIFTVVALVYLRTRKPVPIVLFLAAYPVLVAFDLEFDYQLLAAAGFLLSAAVELDSAQLLLVGAIFVSPLIFIKFGTGLAAVVMLGVAEGLWWYRRSSVGSVILASAVFGICLVAMAWRLFGSAQGFLDFVRFSASLARGYNDSMATAGPTASVVAACLLLISSFVVGAITIRRRLSVALPFVIFAVPIIYSAKHAFLRADWTHMPFFFGLFAYAGSYSLALSRTAQTILLCLALLVGDAALFASVAERQVLSARYGDLKNVLTGGYARYRLSALLDFAGNQRIVAEASRAYLSYGDLLPKDWIEAIGRQSVLVMPWELSLCPANRLECVPYPTLQMYATLTPDLDRWTADHLHRFPPKYAIVELNAIDGRNMVWDCPETWLVLMQEWEVAMRSPDQPRVLLRHRTIPRAWAQQSVGRSIGHVGQWIDVPQTTGPVRLAINLRLSPSGWIRRTAFKPDPVLIHVVTESGRTRAYRIVVDNARLGLMLHTMPMTTNDLAAMFDCCVIDDRVQRFRITGPGAASFDASFEVLWSQIAADRWTRTAAGPPTRVTASVVAGTPLMAIDLINGQSPVGMPMPLNIRSADGMIQVDGWAVDEETRAPAHDVILRWDDGRLDTPADYGLDRPDVAAAFKTPSFRFSGYRGFVSTDDLGVGRHRLTVLVQSADGKTAKLGSPTVQIELK